MRTRSGWLAVAAALGLAAPACSDTATPFEAETGVDAGTDLGMDSGPADTGRPDTGADTGRADTGRLRDAGDVNIEAGMADDGVYDYAIGAITVDDGMDTTVPHFGFNLDGRFSGRAGAPEDCNHADFPSAVDPDQNEGGCAGGTPSCQGGVDNQLAAFAATVRAASGMDVQSELDTQIAEGSLVLLVRVAGVDGALGPTLNDDAVTVSIFQGHPQVPRGMCRSAYERVTRFSVNDRSLMTPGDLATARYRYNGRIVNGRLRVTSGLPGMMPDNTFTLQLPPIMGIAVPLNLHALNVRMSLGNERGGDGNFGGYIFRSEIAATLSAAAPGFESFIDGIVNGLVDLQTGTPPACARPNGGIGVGFGFQSVRATIDATTVSGPATGMCGS